jgi:hypothetical protein
MKGYGDTKVNCDLQVAKKVFFIKRNRCVELSLTKGNFPTVNAAKIALNR